MEKESSTSWQELFSDIAHALLDYNDRREELVDILADSLDECALSFPIMESGASLNTICPFTFFASFCRQMSDVRRKRYLEILTAQLDINAIVPDDFSGIYLVDDSHLRFFSHTESLVQREVDALWRAFVALMGAPSEDCEQVFSDACDTLWALRVAGRNNMSVALSWLYPQRFMPTGEGVECWMGDRVYAFDKGKTDRFLKAFHQQAGADCPHGQSLAQAVDCFQKHWDIDAADFAAMLESSLAEHGGLLFTGYYFNPYKEIMTFAQQDPAFTRQAFSMLFDESRPVVERVSTFEAMTAKLFERYRGYIVSAMPRRSSHGNYHAVSIYLFLRYPETYYLFSPQSFNKLNLITGYDCSYLVRDVESVVQYFEMCDALLTYISEQPSLLEAADKRYRNKNYNSNYHFLIEEAVIFARSYNSEA